MTTETPETWTRHLRETFEAAATPEDLLKQASSLWHYRYCAKTWEYAVPLYRSRMKELWPDHRKATIVVVDLPGILHASWSVSKDDCELPFKMLRNVWRATNPSVFICAVDNGRYKRDMDDAYKADRPEKPPEFYEMCNKVGAELASKNIQIEEHENTESDDIMASVAFRCQLIDQQCILCTEDKDLWQILGKGTALYSHRTKDYRNAEWLLGKHRIRPSQCVDWMSLVGGKNNIDGCKGVGEKTASDWLEAYTDVPGIKHHFDQLKPKQKVDFLEFYEGRYEKVRAIHTLKRDVDVGWAPKMATSQ